jgi:transcriptional regulator with XRE-family HTH domain
MGPYETVRKNLDPLADGRIRADMARAIGRSPQWLSNRLNGQRGRSGITLDTLALLAQAVGAAPYRLLLPVIAEAEERALIMVCHQLAHWVQEASIRIRELARARDSGPVVLGAIRAHGHAWELGASLGAILDPAVGGPTRIVGDGSVDLCPALGTPCPHHENRAAGSDVPDNSERCQSAALKGSAP